MTMRPILALCLLLSSCVGYHRGASGSVSLVTVGTDADRLVAGELVIERMNQSSGLKAGGETLKSLSRIRAGAGLIRAGMHEAGQVAREVVR